MKIYMLLMLIGVIVGFSRLPGRGPSKEVASAPPDSRVGIARFNTGMMPNG